MNIKGKNRVYQVLQELHEDAKKDYLRMSKGIVKSILRPIQPSDFEKAYLPISKTQGETLRKLIIENNLKNIVEFGTSFGISTLYLADAARQIGGRVITTELLQSKAMRAEQNIINAGLGDYVELRTGDAMETLKSHTHPIDFLFLDGWKDLYLPPFKMLEPHFHDRTLIYADNMDMAGTQYYGDYVLSREAYSSRLLVGGKAMLTKMAA